jgi:uncharacterized protein (DUF1330 family)
MPSGYLVADVTVTNPQQYEEYKKWSTAAMQKFGGEICARGGKVEILEGDWQPTRVVIVKFAAFETVKALYSSPEYGKAITARKGASISRMVAVEGV